MYRLVGLACVWFACSYHSPTASQPGDADEPKLDAPPITSCAPGQTLCSGRDKVTCNAAGTGVEASLTVTCPLTCVDAQCYAASHIADADQLACSGASNPPTLMPTGNVTIEMVNSLPQLTCVGNCGPAANDIVGKLVTEPGGAEIAMFCLRQIILPDGVDVDVDTNVSRSIVLFSLLDVSISGDLDINGGSGQFLSAGSRGPGGGGGGDFNLIDNNGGQTGGGSCAGVGGGHTGTGTQSAGGGGGGGGNFAIGGTGGSGHSSSANNTATGGTGGGATCGSSTLLVGGSGGGSGGDGSCAPTSFACGWAGGGGGGAMLIATAGNLQLGPTATFKTNGGAGFGSTFGENGVGGGGGGGAGGMFVLEAAAVLLQGTFELKGGDGGDTDAGQGGNGAATTNLAGGNGATENSAAEGGAGGGGGAGRLHIRLPTSSGTICGTAISDPANVCTAGTLRMLP